MATKLNRTCARSDNNRRELHTKTDINDRDQGQGRGCWEGWQPMFYMPAQTGLNMLSHTRCVGDDNNTVRQAVLRSGSEPSNKDMAIPPQQQ